MAGKTADAPALQLRLENFEGARYDLDALVERISAPLLKGKEKEKDEAPLNTAPLAAALQTCVSSVEKLRRGVSDRIDDLETAQRAVQDQRRQQLGDISDAIEGVQRSFSSLERQLAENGYRVIRVGEQLETLDRQRARAADALELLEHFRELSAGKRDRIDALRKASSTGLQRAAVLARRLSDICREVDSLAPDSRLHIERYCEDLEQDMLRQFDDAYTRGDSGVMAHIARILAEFNGGQSCVQTYVNQHALFATGGRLQAVLTGFNTRTPEQRRESRIVTVANYYGMIAEALLATWTHVREIFPNAQHVMQTLVQRVFAQLVQAFLELVCPLQGLPSNEYLQALAMVHHATRALVEKLRRIDRDLLAAADAAELLGDAPGAPQTAEDAAVAPSDGAEVKPEMRQLSSLGELLERCMGEVFLVHVDGGRYIAAEARALEHRLTSLLQRFSAMLVGMRQSHRKGSVFDTVREAPRALTISVEGLTSATDSPAPPTPTSPTIERPQPSPREPSETSAVLALLNSTDAPDPAVLRALPEQATLVSLPVVKEMLQQHAEAMERCAELSPPAEFAPNFMLLLDALLVKLGDQYLESALLLVQEELAQSDARSEPSFRCDVVLGMVAQAIQLTKTYFEASLLPRLQHSPQGQREFLVRSSAFLQRMDSLLNNALAKQCDSILHHMATLLARQKRTDYKLKDADPAVAQLLSAGGTPTALAVQQFLQKTHHVARLCYGEYESLVAQLMSEIGSGLLAQLLEHYKRFPVSEAGALPLSKDLHRYVDTVADLHVPALTARFELLKLIASLFVVKADNWKSISLEGPLTRLDISVLLPYLQQRTDWARLSKLQELQSSRNAGATVISHAQSGSLGG